MSYLSDLAARIQAEVPKDLLPKGDLRLLFLFYALLGLAKGQNVQEEDVHNAWVAWMTSVGEQHDSLQPYDTLPIEIRRQDGPFVNAIRKAMANRR